MKDFRKTRQPESGDSLRELSDLFLSLFEGSLDGMMLTQQDGTILAANQRMCEMFLMTEDEVLRAGRAGMMVDDERFRAALREQARTGKFQGELAARHSEGSVFPVEISSRLFMTADGREMTAVVVRDISERKRLEDGLRWRENWYRSLFETSQDGIFVVDQETGNFIAANAAASRLYGYTEDEFLRMNIVAISAEPDETGTAIHNSTTGVALRYHRKKDGSVFPVEIAGGYFEEGGRKLHTAFIRDISERKRTEEVVALLSDFRQRVFNSSDAHQVVVGGDGRIVEVNDAWRAFAQANVAGDESIWGGGANYFREYDPGAKDADSIREAYEGIRRVQQGLQIRFEFEYPCHSPIEKRWFTMRVTPLLGTSGAVLISHTNITKQKLAEQALQASEEKYRNVFATESDALVLIDQATGAILDANDAAFSLYGYTRDELPRLKAIDVSAEPEETQQSIMGPDRRVHDRLHRKKDGTVFPVDVSVSHFALDGRPVLLSAVRDMTAARAAEEELKKHRDRLEEMVKDRTAELKRKTNSVEELNAALKVILSQMQERKEAVEERLTLNVRKLILPYLERISKGHLDGQQRLSLATVKAGLDEVVSPFLHNIQQLNLTPRETEVASLIKDGRTTKEIAEIVGVAKRAVDSYRNSIRRKLQLNNKKINLQSYLLSLR